MKRLLTFLAVFLIIYIAATAIINLPSRTNDSQQDSSFQAPTPTIAISGKVKTETKTEGTGAQTAAGDTVSVLYTGMLEDGTVFDQNINRDQPLTFTLGQGKVIRGWEEGILGMKVGEKRTLIIPPELGYGDQRSGLIPPESTLIFDVELLKVDKAVLPDVPRPSLNF